MHFHRWKVLQTLSLLAILLLYIWADSGGRRLTLIDSLCFTPDGSTLIVSRLDGGDAEVPLRHCFANLSRTISEISGSSGETVQLLHSDFKPGSRGVAKCYWEIGLVRSVPGSPDSQRIYTTFGGGGLTATGVPLNFDLSDLQHNVLHIVRSPNGRYIAACGENRISVIDFRKKQIVCQFVAWDLPFLSSPLAAFNSDESLLVSAGVDSICVLDLQSMQNRTLNLRLDGARVRAIALAGDNSVIVCTNHYARRYDFDGNRIAELMSNDTRLCAMSSDGENFVIADDKDVAVFDLENSVPRLRRQCKHCTALAVTSDGTSVAFSSVDDGRVQMLKVATGEIQWTNSVPGRSHWNRSLPLWLFAAWCVASYLGRRSR